MNRYVYTDHRLKKVLLECDAVDILEADKIFKETYPKIELAKSPWIGNWSPDWGTNPTISAEYWQKTSLPRAHSSTGRALGS